MVSSILTEALNDVFKPLGFRKKSANWYRVSGDLYCVVNVQKSPWGDGSCDVNIGFAPAVKAEKGWLPESKCLLRFRAGAITSVSREGLNLLSVETAELRGEDALRADLVEKIADPVARAVNPIDSIQGLRSLLRTNVNNQVFIHRELQDELMSP